MMVDEFACVRWDGTLVWDENCYCDLTDLELVNLGFTLMPDGWVR